MLPANLLPRVYEAEACFVEFRGKRAAYSSREKASIQSALAHYRFGGNRTGRRQAAFEHPAKQSGMKTKENTARCIRVPNAYIISKKQIPMEYTSKNQCFRGIAVAPILLVYFPFESDSGAAYTGVPISEVRERCLSSAEGDIEEGEVLETRCRVSCLRAKPKSPILRMSPDARKRLLGLISLRSN